MPSTISLEEGNAYVNRMRKLIREFPEVDSVVSQHGRPDDGTDAAGFFNAEFFAPLKPADEWPQGVDKDDLTAEAPGASCRPSFPGVEFNFSQYLQDNVAEAVSGVKGENSIKLFGNDLQALTDTANKIKAVLATVHGITDLAVFTSLGQPTVQIDVDRARAARYGLAPGDINSTIKVAIGGDSAGDLYEPGSDRHFPIMVRLAPQYRQSPEAIQNLRIGVQGPNGDHPDPAERGRQRQAGLRARPISIANSSSAICRSSSACASAISAAPSRRRSRRSPSRSSCRRDRGSNGSASSATCRTRSRRLKIVVPITLGLIAHAVVDQLRFGHRHAARHERHPDGGDRRHLRPVPVRHPVQRVGRDRLHRAVRDLGDGRHHHHFPVQPLIDAGLDRAAAVLRTGELQMRPVLMTCVIAGIGLLPAALSTGIGSQVQKPLAVVVVGGMMLAPFVILITLPVLIALLSRRRSRLSREDDLSGSG